VITTNTIESYFSVFKRGMSGVYQHCSKKHLHHYLAEFDFRYNSRSALGVVDGERAETMAKGIVGKRLPIDGLTAKTTPHRIKKLARYFLRWREKVMRETICKRSPPSLSSRLREMVNQ
jgi:hypothetical protein